MSSLPQPGKAVIVNCKLKNEYAWLKNIILSTIYEAFMISEVSPQTEKAGYLLKIQTRQ